MPVVLYRKYRAQNFDELVGQEHITKILKNSIKSNQLSHAYLFVGSRGTGKTSSARILAKAVNCMNPKSDGNPCCKCEACTAIADGSYMDLVEIDAASNRGIDQIRELKEKIEFAPVKGKYKVYIIDEVHMLTTEAFNALLKTLEEPPSHVIFILVTTDVHKLPPTILSRCQRYDFRLGTDEEILKTLKKILKNEDLNVDVNGLGLVVRNARGSFRDALSLLDVVINSQLRSENPKEITEDEVRSVLGIPEIYMVNDLLSALISGDGKKALKCIDELIDKGTNLVQFTNFTLETLREVLVAKISKQKTDEYPFAEDLSLKQLLSLITEFLNVENELRISTNQTLVLQMIIPKFLKDEDTAGGIKEEKKENKEGKKENKEEKKENKEGKTILEKRSESVEVINSDVISVGINQIQESWKKIVNEVKPINTTLFAFLDSSKPVSIKENVLNIEVPFKFYKDQIDSPSSKEILGKVLFESLGTHCKVVCYVNESVKPKLQSSADVVLKNLPVVKQKVIKKDEQENQKNKIDIEAMFAGM